MKTVLILNHKVGACGVQMWGLRSGQALSKSNKYNFIYKEVDSYEEFLSCIQEIIPSGIIYNYHPATMAWLTPDILREFQNKSQAVIEHCRNPFPQYNPGCYYSIALDPEIVCSPREFKVGRLLSNYSGEYPVNKLPTIGSFGFGFLHKQYDMIARIVNNEFDEAVINLLVPFAKYGDVSGDIARLAMEQCRHEITKPGISLNVIHEFLPEKDVLRFLAGNDINAFFYSTSVQGGVSSATDHALSVKRPIIVTRAAMFGHLVNHTPTSIVIGETTIKQTIENGIEPLQIFYDRWSENNFIKSFEDILDEILH